MKKLLIGVLALIVSGNLFGEELVKNNLKNEKIIYNTVESEMKEKEVTRKKLLRDLY